MPFCGKVPADRRAAFELWIEGLSPKNIIRMEERPSQSVLRASFMSGIRHAFHLSSDAEACARAKSLDLQLAVHATRAGTTVYYGAEDFGSVSAAAQ